MCRERMGLTGEDPVLARIDKHLGDRRVDGGLEIDTQTAKAK